MSATHTAMALLAYNRHEYRGVTTLRYHGEPTQREGTVHGTVYTTQHCTEQQNQTCTATLMLIILPITDSSPITRHPTNNGAHDKTRACAINTHDATGAAALPSALPSPCCQLTRESRLARRNADLASERAASDELVDGPEESRDTGHGHPRRRETVAHWQGSWCGRVLRQ